jgi:hypothetical protein
VSPDVTVATIAVVTNLLALVPAAGWVQRHRRYRELDADLLAMQTAQAVSE